MTTEAPTNARDRILEAACAAIAEDGIDDVRIARVAMRAGASTALVHHYFSTREELLEQALMHSYELAAEDRFGQPVDSGASATERLKVMIDECLPFEGRQQQEWILWVELWLRAARDDAMRPLAERLYASYRDWLLAVIRYGVERGEFKVEDPEESTDVAIGLLDGLGVRPLIGDPDMDVDKARVLAATRIARELGIDPEALTE
ncbi:MAG: TetR family transcriptional regulator [Solirubrobacterales bacterium]|nr:TetR family transcriptional regulator [Solirubrobacterales bacterium]MCB0861373.1 TetR family transcriptional regulator [Solirubrobacterales bacterium]MCB0862833.1 TetR family transcriptional regulator [Solirubrobacterales bacterium]